MATLRVLVVEDNPVDALCLNEALEQAKGTKFEISHVETLAEAKERLEKENFNVVVLDLGLPDSQGLTTFSQLQNSAPTTPIVVLSGLDDETVAHEAVRKGAQDYLLKDKYDGYSLSRSINYAIDRKQAETVLRATQERFELALTGADLGWWEWNVQTGEGISDARGAELIGYSPEEIESYAGLWEEVIHPDDKPGAAEALNKHLQGYTALFETEHRVRTKLGEWKWILVRGKIIERDPKGNPLRMAGTYLDITNRKLAENALEVSEQRFRAIFEGAEDYISLKDRSLRYMDVNPAARELFGVPTSEIIGRRHEDLFGGEGSKHTREADSRVLEGATIEGEQTRTIHGIPRTFLYTKTPLRDGSGEIIGIVSISRDVTERKGVGVSPIITQEYPSKAMQSTLKSAILAGKGATTVLLTGESGSGKDYLARYIHDHSDRATGPYFSVNCAAISEGLAESELFGHERGSFTGAVGRKRGLLELAEGGTLLLNEIGELSLPLQSKLLTFLDSRKFTRVGGEKEISVNARLIAATNRDPEREVEEGRFRKDLFYRLNVISIAIPPLRERREDIPLLVQEILSRLSTEMEIHEIPTIDDSTMRALQRQVWTGNVRELRNVLERALIVSPGKQLNIKTLGLGDGEDLPPDDQKASSFSVSFPSDKSLNEMTQDLKRFLVNAALRQSRGRKQAAARLLKISRDSLKHYMKRLGYKEEPE